MREKRGKKRERERKKGESERKTNTRGGLAHDDEKTKLIKSSFSPWCRRYRWSSGPVADSGSIGTTIRLGHTTIDVSVVRMKGSSQRRMAFAE